MHQWANFSFMSPLDPSELLELSEPQSPKGLSNADLVVGLPIPPLDRLKTFSDAQFEEMVSEWAHAFLRTKYPVVRRASGAGDKGRDVIGYKDADISTASWDNYQCKHYDHPLMPSEIWAELGKFCYYTAHGHYSVPDEYYFVSPRGIGPALATLLENPPELKRQLLDNWDSHCSTSIRRGETCALDDLLRGHIEGLDFRMFKAMSPETLIDQHRQTPWHAFRFGGGLQRRPDPPDPPAAIHASEVRYVAQLCAAYGSHINVPIPDPSALSSHPEYESHFRRQREAFYRAESLKEFERDTVPSGEGFPKLKEEIYRGVVDVCAAPHSSGFVRCNATTSAARALQITGNVLVGVLHVEDRSGICHHLANEDRLTWVPE